MHDERNGAGTIRATGHVFRVNRQKGPQWYAKYRRPDGRQVQRRIGPAWTKRGRPADGHFNKRTAERVLDDWIDEAEREGVGGRSKAGGHTFGEACNAWLTYVEVDQDRAVSTVHDYRGTVRLYLVPEFGADAPLDSITTERIDEFRGRLLTSERDLSQPGTRKARLSRRTVQKVLVLLYGILKLAKRRKWIAENPAEDAERVSPKRSGDFNALTAEQVLALARAAETEQDAAIITVAAFTGLRMGELRAMCWDDIDFAAQSILVRRSFTNSGGMGRPKSGKVRSVPLIDQAILPLDGLSRRERFTAPGDLVFPRPTGEVISDDTIRDAFYAALDVAGLDHLRDADRQPYPFRFHDLRHTFGTLGASIWPLHDLQAFMGHANIETTMIYAHHVPKADAAAALSRAVSAAVSAGGAPPKGARRDLASRRSTRSGLHIG